MKMARQPPARIPMKFHLLAMMCRPKGGRVLALTQNTLKAEREKAKFEEAATHLAA